MVGGGGLRVWAGNGGGQRDVCSSARQLFLMSRAWGEKQKEEVGEYFQINIAGWRCKEGGQAEGWEKVLNESSETRLRPHQCVFLKFHMCQPPPASPVLQIHHHFSVIIMSSFFQGTVWSIWANAVAYTGNMSRTLLHTFYLSTILGMPVGGSWSALSVGFHRDLFELVRALDCTVQ